MATPGDLKEAYFRLRADSVAFQQDSHVVEGVAWKDGKNMLLRKKDGWEMRVYEIEGEIEVCLIAPDGTSKTYA